jgi:hypothetical protein
MKVLVYLNNHSERDVVIKRYLRRVRLDQRPTTLKRLLFLGLQTHLANKPPAARLQEQPRKRRTDDDTIPSSDILQSLGEFNIKTLITQAKKSAV